MKAINSQLLSVIVTVYGTEKLLPRCIDSILNCTYKNLELIIVDDKSPGNVAEIVQHYMEQDKRVKFVRHDINKGLYLARITGLDNAQGQYIAFLDSDDHVSVDFYRRLIEKSELTNSDMVIGEIYLEQNNKYSYYNLSNVHIQNIDVVNTQASELLYKQHGLDYTLHVVWNKIYRRDLVDKCLPYFKLQNKHLIMCEDVLFSCIFYYFAKHVTNIHGDFVYYYQNDNSSTALSANFSKYEKNISDVKLVFSTLHKIFENEIKDSTYISDIENWNFLLMKIWRRNVRDSQLSSWKKKKLYNLLERNSINCREIPNPEDEFFYSEVTSCNNIKSEELKLKIMDSDITIVSFDIFDTLIARPFWEPVDLFYLLDIYVNRLLNLSDYIDFKAIRITAESMARQKSKLQTPMWEDITLDDIYGCVKEILDISDENIKRIEKKEIELEVQYCNARNFAKELFDMAKYVGKKIIITSDMYLPREIIEKILIKNEYVGYDLLFLSSEVKLTKDSGNLYKHIIKELNVEPSHILHIGDNYYSDVKSARKIGIHSVLFPKATALLSNSLDGVYSGGGIENIYIHPFGGRDKEQFKRFWGLKTMLGVIANRIFDNPYVIINKESDFNGDPRFIGYYAVGMQVFAFSQWVIKQVQDIDYDNVNFMARDGYLPMKAFELLSPIYGVKKRINYTYLTRSVVLPLQISNEIDLYSISQNLNIHGQSPESLINLLKEIVKESALQEAENICQRNNILYKSNFNSIESFYLFVKIFNRYFLDMNKLFQYKEKVKLYLQPLFSGRTATIDVGYSCRIESVLKKNFNFDVTPYYMHINNDIPLRRGRKCGLKINTYYSYSPGVTGILRELFISKLEASCKTLEFTPEGVKPIFKEHHLDYITEYVISTIQNSALQFVNDMVRLFDKDIELLTYQREDAALPLEYYQSTPKYFDRLIFSAVPFEDDLGVGKQRFNVLEYWNGQIANVNWATNFNIDTSLRWMTPMWKRVLCLYFIDRNYLKYKVKMKLAGQPKKLAAIQGIYRFFRKIYRAFK